MILSMYVCYYFNSILIDGSNITQYSLHVVISFGKHRFRIQLFTSVFKVTLALQFLIASLYIWEFPATSPEFEFALLKYETKLTSSFPIVQWVLKYRRKYIFGFTYESDIKDLINVRILPLLWRISVCITRIQWNSFNPYLFA